MITSADAARAVLARREARSGLLPFTCYTFPGYQTNWHHERLANTLDGFASGLLPRVMVFMPPQHGKSELVSRRLPARILGQSPTSRIVACSHTADLAEKMNRDVQRIMGSERYRSLYPGTQLGGGSHGKAIRNTRELEILDANGDYTGGSYRNAGVGGAIAGLPMDVGIIDDPIRGRADAESPTLRDATWDWYTGDFLSRTHERTRILVTCTRWHEDDLAGRLLKQQPERWHVVCFPAIRDTPRVDDADPDPRGIGEPLWPEMHGLESLQEKRDASPYDWASLYQQNPTASGLVEWPAEYFGPHLWFEEWLPDSEYIAKAMGIDPSKGRADKAGDYSGIVCLAVDRSGCLWVDADMDQQRPVEPLAGSPGAKSIIEDALALWLQFGAGGVLVEANGFQEWVARSLQRLAASRNVALPLYTVVSTLPKPIRIRTLGPYLAQRRLKVRLTRGGKLLVDQLRMFPTADHDDGPDALKTAELMADYLVNGRKAAAGVQALAA